jgi:membrane-associated protein
MDLTTFIQAAGYAGVTAIVFAESGLLIGFFLPGDSLLFTAGLLASQGYFNIWWLTLLTAAAAIIGDNVGYSFGHKWGRRLFEKKDGRFFRRENLLKAEKFYEEYGAKTIVLARFMPFIRTFAPIVAGIGQMDYRTFFRYNLLGGLLWAVGMNLAGFWLGRTIPGVDRYLLPIIIVIVLISVIAPAREYLANKRAK